MFLMGITGLIFSLAAALGIWNVVDQAPKVPEANLSNSQFDGSLLVLTDADMTATAYADGVLHPIANTTDQLIQLQDVNSATPQQNSLTVSNSVMGWPGSMVIYDNSHYAYVVETRGQIDRSISSLENGVFVGMPTGTLLSTVDLRTNTVISELEICTNPSSVDISPDNTWLLVACRDSNAELMVVSLIESLPLEVQPINLDVLTYSQRPQDIGPSYAVIHPSGKAAAVILENQAVTLVQFDFSTNTLPTSATAEEPISLENRWLSVARWTKSGKHILLADVAWGAAPIQSVINKNGGILSYALSPDDNVRALVSEVKTSLSPEAFEINDDGTLLAVVNMERSYLPNNYLSVVPRRGSSSLSLVSVNDTSGELTIYGEAVGFKGVLPEDAVFDTDSDQIAVVIYQDHDKPKSNGWLIFFDIDYSEEVPKLVLTDKRVELPRGAHDLTKF